MRRNRTRPRRIASPRKLRVLRLVGWRYSSAREAWVHRALRGRMGPVFVDTGYDPHPELAADLSLFDAPRSGVPVLLAPDDQRPPLPRRDTTPTPTISRVFARLTDGEEPRVVVVDGRPPRRGVELPASTAGNVVVPIKSARATG